MNNYNSPYQSSGSYYDNKNKMRNPNKFNDSWNNSFQTYSPMGTSYQSYSPMNRSSPWNGRQSYQGNGGHRSYQSYGSGVSSYHHSSDQDSSLYASMDSTSDADKSSLNFNCSTRNYYPKESSYGNSVMHRSIEDPWERLRPKRSLEDGQRLAPAPPSQRATELFAVRARKSVNLKRLSDTSPKQLSKKLNLSPPSPSCIPTPKFCK